MPLTRLIGYAPDIDPTTPGALPNCAALIPSQKGMEGAPSAQTSTSLPVLLAACVGAATLRQSDGTRRTFAGTAQSFIYEDGTSTWTPRTATLTGLNSGERWRFCQFGDVSVAASLQNIIQTSSASAFANATANAPKAGIVATAGNFVIAFDVVDQGGLYYGTDTAVRDGWWCCAQNDTTDWTPDVDTQAATGRLRSSPGAIVGAHSFGYQCVAYKKRAMYLGTYVGGGQGAAIWDWQEIPGAIGAITHEAVVNVGTMESPQHIFMGDDSFFSYRGGMPVEIGQAVKDTVFAELNRDFAEGCCAAHDRTRKLVRFFYPAGSAYTPDKCVVYNYQTNQWGRDDQTIEFAFNYSGAGITYDNLGNFYSTYADLPAKSYDTAFIPADVPLPAIFNTSHQIQTLTGACTTASVTLNDIGDELVETLINGILPRFIESPTTATLIHFYRDTLGASLTTGQSITLANGRFDFQASAAWHRMRIDLTGDFVLAGYRPQVDEDGVTI